MDLVSHLKHSSWTLALEHDLERFPLSTYLDRLDRNYINDQDSFLDGEFPEKFLNYLEGQVSNYPAAKPTIAFSSSCFNIYQGKYGLYHHHCQCYLDYVMSSITNPPTREKFHLMSTVWFVLQEPFTSLKWDIKCASWDRLCAALFGFNYAEIEWDYRHGHLMRDPKEYGDVRTTGKVKYGHIAETTRLIPESIRSHRLSRVAISCIQYLHHMDSNARRTRDKFLAWAKKSKQSPWLWKQRMRVTSRGRRPDSDDGGPKYLFPQSLRRSRQVLYSNVTQSENFYQKRQTFYIWTLDLLHHTLQKAMKSEELTRALSKLFIPPLAHILFPRRTKRVRRAVEAYLEVSQRTRLNLETPTKS